MRVSYFTAVIAGDGHGWRARDVDVEDAANLDDLADMLRGAAYRDGPVLAVIEREDEWFALFRVDGDEEPRVFVSDVRAAARSAFGELIASAVDTDVAPPSAEDEDETPAPTVPDPDDDHEPDDDELATDTDPGDPPVVEDDGWAGDADLLEDLGCSGAQLQRLVAEQSDDPAAVLVQAGEACGFSQLLDALR